MDGPGKDIERLLERLGAGEVSQGELLEALYADLREAAERLMRGERDHHTLQPTALVHEAFLRLVDGEKVGEQGRLHFLDAAAVTMRRVLVDHARARGALKRGGAWERVTLMGLEDQGEEEVDLEALHRALETLEQLDPRQARIVELRFFAGLTGQEIATHLNVSRNTVVRELTMARAWLERELSREG